MEIDFLRALNSTMAELRETYCQRVNDIIEEYKKREGFDLVMFLSSHRGPARDEKNSVYCNGCVKPSNNAGVSSKEYKGMLTEFGHELARRIGSSPLIKSSSPAVDAKTFGAVVGSSSSAEQVREIVRQPAEEAKSRFVLPLPAVTRDLSIAVALAGASVFLK